MGASVEVQKDSNGVHIMYMNITEVEDEEMPRTFSNSGRNCLPDGVQISVIGSSKTRNMIEKYENKAWHLSICLVLLTVAATVFTVQELREVGQSLEQRQLYG